MFHPQYTMQECSSYLKLSWFDWKIITVKRWVMWFGEVKLVAFGVMVFYSCWVPMQHTHPCMPCACRRVMCVWEKGGVLMERWVRMMVLPCCGTYVLCAKVIMNVNGLWPWCHSTPPITYTHSLFHNHFGVLSSFFPLIPHSIKQHSVMELSHKASHTSLITWEKCKTRVLVGVQNRKHRKTEKDITHQAKQ